MLSSELRQRGKSKSFLTSIKFIGIPRESCSFLGLSDSASTKASHCK